MRHFLDNRNTLGLLFMLPAGVLLLLFLTYPLGLGTWLGFTDAKIGRVGEWIGIENFQFLIGDSVARLSLFNTLFYTTVASVLKFVLGLWLALILNRHLPFKSFIRAIVLLPFIVPTALSAIAFWWACRPFRCRSMKPPRSTARRPGSSSGTSRCRCSRRSSRW